MRQTFGLRLYTILVLLSLFIFQSATAAPLHATYTPFSGARMYYTPHTIDFGPVGLETTSPEIVITIFNTGSVVLNQFAGGAVDAPFSVSQNCAGGVAPAASCQLFVNFTPTEEGEVAATSNLSTNAGRIIVNMRGEGVGAKMQVSTHSLNFGQVNTGVISPQQTVIIKNIGRATLTNFAGGGVAAPFGASQNCASGVAPGASCQFFYDFRPTAMGEFTAISSFSANGGTAQIQLNGTNITQPPGPLMWATPFNIDFGEIGVGTSSETRAVTITNQGSGLLNSFSGGASDNPAFGALQNCGGKNLSTGQSCEFFYTFTPTAVGPFSASTTVGSNGGSANITLQGTAVEPQLTYSAHVLDFGPTAVGSTSDIQTVTIRNTGRSPLTDFAGGAPGEPFYASQNCVPTVAVDATCSLSFYFTPPGIGRFHRTAALYTNAGAVTVELYGGELLSTYLPVLMK